jgi:hypothetical protein
MCNRLALAPSECAGELHLVKLVSVLLCIAAKMVESVEN